MDQEGEELTDNSTKWTKTEKFTLATFYVTTVIVNIYYSLMGPFFPQQVSNICIYSNIKFQVSFWMFETDFLYTIKIDIRCGNVAHGC